MCHSILYLLIICFIASPISELSKVNLFPSHCIALGKSSVDFFYLFFFEKYKCVMMLIKCVVIFTFILYLYFIWYQLFQV